MFFLFRCLFWLGLVFSQIAALEGTDAAALIGRSAQAGGQQAASLRQTALDAASRHCAGAPEQCLALAARTASLAQAAAGASQDSLNAGDRLPAWRLRGGKAPD
jgi:hypothetical protein